MIAEFTVENFRSFKEKSTFSLLATPKKELLEQNTFEVNKKQRLLKSAVIYGANASGKTSFFSALRFFRQFAVFSGPHKQSGDRIETDIFRFSKQTLEKPSSFELIFFVRLGSKFTRYRYGLSVTTKEVIAEYLYAVNNVREVMLFVRNKQEVTISGHFQEGTPELFKKMMRPNSTFLSVCAQGNGEIAMDIVSYLKNLFITSGLQNISNITKNYLREGQNTHKIIDLLKYADIHINHIELERTPLYTGRMQPELVSFLKAQAQNEPLEQETFLFGHSLFDNESSVGDVFISEQNESSGTRKLFSYSVPVFNALENGTPLFIDEFDAQLHPLIIEGIVKLFSLPQHNRYNAQLVISCHSVNILTKELFRRDQIWFCAKDEFGASELYSLAEYDEPVRNDAAFNKNYLHGKYGAIPFIDEINLRLEQSHGK